MKPTLHVYTVDCQPATRFKLPGLGEVFRFRPHQLARCAKCGRNRQMRNLRVKAYYDAVHYFCAEACR
jgi:hypothetical protein